MARAHVEYLQSQALPWQPCPWPHLPGCQAKVLSRDDSTGSATALVRIPAGWSVTGPGYLDTGQELFVVDGVLDINGRRYEQDCYAWLPAGYSCRSCSTQTGAVALMFYDAEPAWSEGMPGPGSGGAEPAIEFRDAYDMRWECGNMDPVYADSGMRWKLLRGSPDATQATMLVYAPPHAHPPGWKGRQEVHDCVEEMFLLSGDYQSPLGQMCAGAYFWRPPGVAHGPYGSRGGSLALIRTLGAPLRNHWTSHSMSILREPAYAPVLPDSLRTHVRQPWRPQFY